MATENHTDKSVSEIEDRVWDLAEKLNVCMFTTWDGESQRARPLSARVHREEHAIHFLVDASGEKNWQVEKYPKVLMTFTDGSSAFVAITGKAKVSNDRAKIKDLWSSFDKAWWDNENDPAIRVLSVSPDDAELWDGPNSVVAAAKMVTAAVTGMRPSLGDNAKVEL